MLKGEKWFESMTDVYAGQESIARPKKPSQITGTGKGSPSEETDSSNGETHALSYGHSTKGSCSKSSDDQRSTYPKLKKESESITWEQSTYQSLQHCKSPLLMQNFECTNIMEMTRF